MLPRDDVQISARRPAVVTEVFDAFPKPLQANARIIQGVSLAIGPKVFLITFKVIDVI
jgi:hypothetical protein